MVYAIICVHIDGICLRHNCLILRRLRLVCVALMLHTGLFLVEKATGCGHDMARHAYDTLLLGGEKDIAEFITMHTMHAPKMPPTRSSAPKKQVVPQLQV